MIRRTLVLLAITLCFINSLICILRTKRTGQRLLTQAPTQGPPAVAPEFAVHTDDKTATEETRTSSDTPGVVNDGDNKKQRQSIVASWAGTRKTASSELRHSSVSCSVPENNHFGSFKTCHCRNCCVQNKVVYVFDNSTERFSNITSQYMTAVEKFGIVHAPLLQESFVGSPWVETPVHYTGVKRQHILALWFWNADVWSTWKAEGWVNETSSLRNSFHWMLMDTIVRRDRDYLTNFWFAANHPMHEPPVALRESDPTVCYRHMMIGHHHTGQNLFANAVARVPLGTNAERPVGINQDTSRLLRTYSSFFVERTGLATIKPNPKKAILMSRRDSKKGRKILNELELVSVVEEEGFDVEEVVFTNMTLEESNKRMREASLVFGSHGAGFANIMVCSNATAVLELHPWGFQKWGYAHVAKILGLDYRYWLAPNETFTEHSNASSKFRVTDWNYYRHRNYRVDVDEFRTIVKDIKKRKGGMTLGR